MCFLCVVSAFPLCIFTIVCLFLFDSFSLRFLCAFCVLSVRLLHVFWFSWCVLRVFRAFSARCFGFLCVFCASSVCVLLRLFYVFVRFLFVFCAFPLCLVFVLRAFLVFSVSFVCVFCVCEGVLASKLDADNLKAKHESKAFQTITFYYLLLLLLLPGMASK